MKAYHVEGIRHCAVVFAETSEEAIAQAAEQGSVGKREAPSAVEVPSPRDHQIIYDPQQEYFPGAAHS